MTKTETQTIQPPVRARFARPPSLTDESGARRTVGIELEMAELGLEPAAKEIRAIFGGRIHDRTLCDVQVTNETYGTFRVELDSEPLKRFAATSENHSDSESNIMDEGRQAVVSAASNLVPLEVVSPPLSVDDLPRFDLLCDGLAALGAKGTQESMLYAFGTHINPSAASLSPGSILAHLQAFVLNYDVIILDRQVDWVRRVAPFIRPFPSDYVTLITTPDYHPTLDDLVKDYLDHNPTRNRALDMLPLFRYLRPELVNEALPNEKINTRPTYHYRLGDCRLGTPDWSIASVWNQWVQIERLADADRERKRAMEAFRKHEHGATLLSPKTDWGEYWSKHLEPA